MEALLEALLNGKNGVNNPVFLPGELDLGWLSDEFLSEFSDSEPGDDSGYVPYANHWHTIPEILDGDIFRLTDPQETADSDVIRLLQPTEGMEGVDFTYSIIGNHSDIFMIVGNEIRLREGARYNPARAYRLEIQITDAAGNTMLRPVVLQPEKTRVGR